MNHFKIIPLILLIFVSCKSDFYKDATLHRVLSDFDRHSYYIGVMVKSGDSTSPYIIKNGSLYRFYKKKDGLTENRYERLLKSTIRKNNVIEIDSADLVKFGFQRVNPSPALAVDMAADTSIILSKYFEKPTTTYLINTAVNADLWNEIVYTLFKKGVFTKTEDESGMLYVPNEQFEK